MTHPLFQSDILRIIFRGLPFNTLLCAASTCKRWKQVVDGITPWKFFSSQDWPLAYAQAQGVLDWKAWYRSHYFAAYAPLFTLDQRCLYSHKVVQCKEAYWKGVAFRMETFVMVGREHHVNWYHKPASVLRHLQNNEIIGSYEHRMGGNWPAIADDIVFKKFEKNVLGFSVTPGNPFGTPGLKFDFENVLAFTACASNVGLLFADQIHLYTLLVDAPGRRGSLIKTFTFDKTESTQAFLHLTLNRVLALFPNQKLLIFDIDRDERPMATLHLMPGNWTVKGDLLYYHDAEQLSEIDVITGKIKRALKLPPHISMQVFSNPGRMACAKDYLAFMAGDTRRDGLFLFVLQLKDFTVTGSRQMDRSDGHLKAYENVLLIGRECESNKLNMQRKGMVGILDLESREYLDHLRCSSIGARPLFYDGQIVAVSSETIDFWKIEGIKPIRVKKRH